MKQLMTIILLLFAISNSPTNPLQKKSPVINLLEDFFRFENIDQLNTYFGEQNVDTEITYFDNPNTGASSYLVSNVNFGTPYSAMVIWNKEGTQLCEVRASAYFLDLESNELKLIPNQWKTHQGIHAGMSLSQLVRLNCFGLSFEVHPETEYTTYGELQIRKGRIHKKVKVPFSTQPLVFNYTLDLKQIKDYFPDLRPMTLESRNKVIKGWNPMLEMITIYREGLSPVR